MKKIVKNNQGYSLVELVLTMAIFSIVMLAIIMMMRTSIATYREGIFETSMQEEAQIVANQVGDFIVDASAGVDNKDGTYSFNGPEGNFTLSLNSKGELLYKGKVLSDKVSEFSIQGLENRSSEDSKTIYDNRAKVHIGISYDGRTFSADKDIYFRNNIEDIAIKDGKPVVTPYDVTGGSSSSSEESDDSDSLTVRRYQDLNISADKDLVYNVSLNTAALGLFTLTDDDNPMFTKTIKISESGVEHEYTSRQYIISVFDPEDFGGHTEPEIDYIVSGYTSKGVYKEYPLKLDPVSLDVGAGVFDIYRKNDENTSNGYPTYIEAKGISINDALNNGMQITYTADLYSNGSKKATYEGALKHSDSNYAGDFEYGSDKYKPTVNYHDKSKTGLLIGVITDPATGGIAISKGIKQDALNGPGDNGYDFMLGSDYYNPYWADPRNGTLSDNKNEINFTFTFKKVINLSETETKEITETRDADFYILFNGQSLEAIQ